MASAANYNKNTLTMNNSCSSNSSVSEANSSSTSNESEDSHLNHEVIQLQGINDIDNITVYSDLVVLIQDQQSPVSTSTSKFSSLLCFQNLRRNVRDKIYKQHLRFVHSEIHRDMKLKQRWILATFIVVAVLIVLLCTLLSRRSSRTGSYSQKLGITINLEKLTERSKCPACYGVNICPQILTGKIILNDWNKFTISKLANSKNIFYATWNDQGMEKQVVLKKLAHDHELEQLDKAICDRHGKSHQCDVRQAVISLINKYSHKSSHHEPYGPLVLNGEKVGSGSDVLLCPSHRKMEFLIDAHKKFARGQHHNTILANVLTTLLLNPEPLLLQAFPSSEGWPFPQYLGACGRLISEEYIGRRLTTYYREPFHIRAFIAKQLLEIANQFNENPTNFILYMTDISPNNFAIHEDSNIVKIVDLENIIVVDKDVVIESKVPDHDKLLVAESVYCRENGNIDNMCLSFSVNDLCERPLADHNYYAICAGLLAPSPLSDEFPDGLLHSIPSELNENTNLSQILELCKNPKTSIAASGLHLKDRIAAAQSLIEILGKYLQNQRT